MYREYTKAWMTPNQYVHDSWFIIVKEMQLQTKNSFHLCVCLCSCEVQVFKFSLGGSHGRMKWLLGWFSTIINFIVTVWTFRFNYYAYDDLPVKITLLQLKCERPLLLDLGLNNSNKMGCLNLLKSRCFGLLKSPNTAQRGWRAILKLRDDARELFEK